MLRRLLVLELAVTAVVNAWPLVAAISWPFIRRTIPTERARILAALASLPKEP